MIADAVANYHLQRDIMRTYALAEPQKYLAAHHLSSLFHQRWVTLALAWQVVTGEEWEGVLDTASDS